MFDLADMVSDTMVKFCRHTPLRAAPMAHVPSLPPELVSIVARFLEPSAWSTARALSKAYRDAVHERTKDPAALDELLWHMHLTADDDPPDLHRRRRT